MKFPHRSTSPSELAGDTADLGDEELGFQTDLQSQCRVDEQNEIVAA